jgi:hypothetical protein
MFQNKELTRSQVSRTVNASRRPPTEKMTQAKRRLLSQTKKGANKGEIEDHEKFI